MKSQTLFTVYQGDDFAALFKVTDSLGAVSDITEWDLEITLKQNPLSPDNEAELHIPSLLIDPADAVKGEFYLTLDRTLTGSLSTGHYYLNMRRRVNGVEVTLLNGRISIVNESHNLTDVQEQVVRVQLDQPEGLITLQTSEVSAESLSVLYAIRDAVEADRVEVATNVGYLNSIYNEVVDSVPVLANSSAEVELTNLLDYTRSLSLNYAMLDVVEGPGFAVDFRLEVISTGDVLFEYLNIDDRHDEKTPVYMNTDTALKIVVTNKSASNINLDLKLIFTAY